MIKWKEGNSPRHATRDPWFMAFLIGTALIGIVALIIATIKL